MWLIQSYDHSGPLSTFQTVKRQLNLNTVFSQTSDFCAFIPNEWKWTLNTALKCLYSYCLSNSSARSVWSQREFLKRSGAHRFRKLMTSEKNHFFFPLDLVYLLNVSRLVRSPQGKDGTFLTGEFHNRTLFKSVSRCQGNQHVRWYPRANNNREESHYHPYIWK